MMRALTVVVCLLGSLAIGAPAQAGGHVALVIGNGAYKNVPKLENPQSDAHAMAALLKSIGFDVVEGIDLTRDRMTERLLEFGKKAAATDTAIFFYAGQGVAVDGANYALPVDADIKSVADLKLGAAVNIDDALEQALAGAKIKLVFLDMSRTNPFAARVTAGRSNLGPGGLAEMRTAEGTLITFASGPGQPALDGPKGGHSPFTQALLDHLTEPGVEIQQVMTEVRAEVHELTNNAQLSWGNSNLVGTVYLNPKSPAPAGTGKK
jgi:uncharacterized caspase-like protein